MQMKPSKERPNQSSTGMRISYYNKLAYKLIRVCNKICKSPRDNNKTKENWKAIRSQQSQVTQKKMGKELRGESTVYQWIIHVIVE